MGITLHHLASLLSMSSSAIYNARSSCGDAFLNMPNIRARLTAYKDNNILSGNVAIFYNELEELFKEKGYPPLGSGPADYSPPSRRTNLEMVRTISDTTTKDSNKISDEEYKTKVIQLLKHWKTQCVSGDFTNEDLDRGRTLNSVIKTIEEF